MWSALKFNHPQTSNQNWCLKIALRPTDMQPFKKLHTALFLHTALHFAHRPNILSLHITSLSTALRLFHYLIDTQSFDLQSKNNDINTIIISHLLVSEYAKE